MKIIDPSYEILDYIDGERIVEKIERVGRVCYKSEDRIAPGTAYQFVKMLIERGHEAMLEHAGFSVKFIVDRGVSHEIVRHRLASFAQESTRYCNYGKAGEVTFVRPSAKWAQKDDNVHFDAWYDSVTDAERSYLSMLENGCTPCTPQEARAVLPNSLKTEIVVTANIREWRHILKLRTAATAHPDMQAIMRPLCLELKMKIPVVFSDINW